MVQAMTRVATVFGGSGFIGRYIVMRLAKEGWVVRVPVRDPEAAHFLQPLGNVGQIVRMGVAIQDEAAVKWAVEGADAVFNCTGILFEPSKHQTFEELHHRGPERIAKAAADAGVKRLVHISAIGADSKSESLYAQSKGRGEKAVLKAFPDATILRPSLVIGPEDGFFNRFAVMARLSPALPLIGGGKTKFQPVYVGDVADAAMKAVHDPATKGQTYELGGPRTYTFKQLMEMLLKEIRRKRLLLPVPFSVAEIQGRVLQLLPSPPLTKDQVTLLKKDNVVSKKRAKTFEDLGIKPQAIEVIIPAYLERYRPGGRFQDAARYKA
ncbi:complex I NDUFA9 subunit family protein [Ferruginivarius sediminum]|uniref:Complex I NDUFA9 subunit family protein n=2 Tax=Ferruginivarius sediminum TaxID=2661937 RepID=A0A369TBH1_9PROT|nr:complex I NDUFA9 subunit family protein [Ferruginivarius sediminum]